MFSLRFSRKNLFSIFFLSCRSVFYVVGYRKTRSALSRFRNMHKPFRFQPPLSFPKPVSDVDRKLRLENLFSNYQKSRSRTSLVLDDLSIFSLSFRHYRTEVFAFMIPTRYEVDPPDLEKRIMRLLAFFYKRKPKSRSKTRFHLFAHLTVAPRSVAYGPDVVSNVKGRYGNNDLYLYVICNLRPSVRRLRFLWSSCFDPKGQLYRDHVILFPKLRERSSMHALFQSKVEEYYKLQNQFKVSCGRRNFTRFKESLVIPCYISKSLSRFLITMIIFRSFPMEPYNPRLTPFLPNVSQLASPQFGSPYFFMALEGDLFYPPLPPLITFYFASNPPFSLIFSLKTLYQKVFSFSPRHTPRIRRGINRFSDVYGYVYRLRREAEKYVMDTAPWLTRFLDFSSLPFNYKEALDRHRRLDTLSALRYQKKFCAQVGDELSPVFSSLDDVQYTPTLSSFKKDFSRNIKTAGPQFLKLFTPNPKAPKEVIDEDFWYFHSGRKNTKFSFPRYIKKGVSIKPKKLFGPVKVKKGLFKDLTWSAWYFGKLDGSLPVSMDDFPFSASPISGPSINPAPAPFRNGLIPYRRQRIFFKLFGSSPPPSPKSKIGRKGGGGSTLGLVFEVTSQAGCGRDSACFYVKRLFVDFFYPEREGMSLFRLLVSGNLEHLLAMNFEEFALWLRCKVRFFGIISFQPFLFFHLWEVYYCFF